MASSKSQLNINLIFVTIIVTLGSSIMFGYNIAALNQPKQLVIDFYNETYTQRYGYVVSSTTLTVLWSLTTALFIPGGMFGSILGGWLADRIGRKRTIIFSHMFVIAGSVLSCACVAASAPELLMIGRVLVGINSGLGNCIAPMVLLEIAPASYRGAFGTIHQLSVTLGILVASVFGMPQLLGTANGWPFILLLEVIPAIMSLIAMPFLPDTPRYLLLIKKNRKEALKALEFYRRSKDVSADMSEMDAEGKSAADRSASKLIQGKDDIDNKSLMVKSADSKKQSKYTWRQLLADVELRRPLRIACMLVVIQQFSGINAFFFFSQSVFENARIDPTYIPFAVIGVNAVNFFATILVVPLLDKAGRRPLLIGPSIVMVVDLIVMTASLILQTQYPEVDGIGYVSIGCVVAFVFCFAFGLGPIPWIMGPELFRQGPRPTAMAAVNVVMWMSAFVIAMGFEPLQDWAKQYTFIVFLVLMIGFCTFMFIYLPETKNKTFEEIANELVPKPKTKKIEMLPLSKGETC